MMLTMLTGDDCKAMWDELMELGLDEDEAKEALRLFVKAFDEDDE
jgi:hypothetical protein